MKKFLRVIGYLVSMICICLPKVWSQPWQSLLNDGKLHQWQVPENNTWYLMRPGKVLHIQSGPDKKGSILWTKSKYKNFKFSTYFKMGEGTVDSGVFLRGEGDQIQIGISGSLKRDMTASPYIPGKGYPVEAKDVARILKPKDWNKMDIELIGNVYTVWLNNKKVMTYTSANMPVEGPVGLQLHPGNVMTIDYKKIKIKPL